MLGQSGGSPDIRQGQQPKPPTPQKTRRPTVAEPLVTVHRCYQPEAAAVDDLVEALCRLLAETLDDGPELTTARESAASESPCFSGHSEG